MDWVGAVIIGKQEQMGYQGSKTGLWGWLHNSTFSKITQLGVYNRQMLWQSSRYLNKAICIFFL